MTATMLRDSANLSARTPLSTPTPMHRSEAIVRARPLFEGIDVAGFVVATIMALGPLTAYAVGA
jgi:hypothetical protein